MFSIGFGQTNWIKGNAVWHYNFTNISYGWIKLWTAGDTLIQTKTCTILRSVKHEFVTMGPNGDVVEAESPYISGYLYFENDTVFRWETDHFVVLYDFTADPGDSWIISRGVNSSFGCNDTSICHVDVVSSVVLDGTTYNQFVLSPAADAGLHVSGLVNARFGASSQYLLPFGRSCDQTIVDFDQIQLTCFQDDSLYYNPSGSGCEYYLGMEEGQYRSLLVYPNPAQNQIELLSDEVIGNISVYDMFGKLIEEINTIGTMQKIDVSGYESGFYFLHIETLEGEKIVRSFQISGK